MLGLIQDRPKGATTIRLGVVPALDPTSGGMYQYSEMMLRSLERSDLPGIERLLVIREGNAPPSAPLPEGWDSFPLSPRTVKSLARRMIKRALPVHLLESARSSIGKRETRRIESRPESIRDRLELRERLADLGVDVLLFPAPDPFAFEIGVPSIMAIHDLQHRLQPEFPEVSADGEATRREYLFRNAVARCLFILVDSEIGKEDVLQLYGDVVGDGSKVKVLPFVPAPSLRIDIDSAQIAEARDRLGLPDRFLFYPSQFWPHKNHARIVEAIARLHDKGTSTPIAFTGSGDGAIKSKTLAELNAMANQRGVSHLVHHLGYVSDADMSVLYSSAAALVMPTFFGPTNIPVIEAWNFGLPVITSDIRGIREQVGDAALLVDPRSVGEIEAAIERLWTDESVAQDLRSTGRRKLDGYTPDDHRRRLESILLEARDRLARKA